MVSDVNLHLYTQGHTVMLTISIEATRALSKSREESFGHDFEFEMNMGTGVSYGAHWELDIPIMEVSFSYSNGEEGPDVTVGMLHNRLL